MPGTLVLSRKINERVMIEVPPSTYPQTIEVVVVDIRGDKSRLGFRAEPEIVIDREEVLKAKLADRRQGEPAGSEES